MNINQTNIQKLESITEQLEDLMSEIEEIEIHADQDNNGAGLAIEYVQSAYTLLQESSEQLFEATTKLGMF